MKKAVGTIGLVIMLGLSLVACGKGKTQIEENKGNVVIGGNQQEIQEETVAIEPLNKEYAVKENLDKIVDISRLNEFMTMSQQDIETNYNFGEYKNLQKEIRSRETDEEFREIALVKLGDVKQSEDLYMIMLNRLESLKQKHSANKKISEILNDPASVVLKQQGKVLVFIIAENAKEIEAEIDKSFN